MEQADDNPDGEPLPQALEPFTYSRLWLSSDAIRLLEVDLSTDSGPISCKMHYCSLFDRHYNALSYTWGDAVPPSELKTIIVNGCRLGVRHNLYDFLERYRARSWGDLAAVDRRLPSSSTAPLLWVDAICINQEDVREKNHQVDLMDRIYKTANHVLIWLGESFSDAAFVFAGLRALAAKKLIRDPTELRRMKEGMQSLADLAYWRRIWIVQEVLLARNALILSGEHSLPWQTLRDALSFRGFNYRILPENTTTPSPMLELVSQSERFQGRADLKHLILRFGNHECQEAHDHVYALSGLTHKTFPVNYAEPMDALICKVLNRCITSKTESRSFVEHLLRCLKVDKGIEHYPLSCATFLSVERTRRSIEADKKELEAAEKEIGEKETDRG